MKKITFFILIIAGLFSNAQQQDLFDNNWYLTMITLEGEDFPTPPSDTHSVMGEPTSIIYFTKFSSTETFFTEGCHYFEIYMQNFNDNSFSVTGITSTLEDCMYPLYAAHDNRMFNFFGGGPDENFPWEGFIYEIILNPDNSQALKITNPDGDIALYNNQILSIDDLEFNQNPFLIIFQNDDLIIQSNSAKAQSVAIFDLNGKLVLKSNVLNDKLNTTGLTKGIYLIQLTDEKGNIFSKKIRKL